MERVEHRHRHTDTQTHRKRERERVEQRCTDQKGAKEAVSDQHNRKSQRLENSVGESRLQRLFFRVIRGGERKEGRKER